MLKSKIIYTSPPKTFAKRVLQEVGKGWLFFLFMIIIGVTLGYQDIGPMAFFLIFFIIASATILNTALVRAKWQITEIEATSTDFLISVLQYDIRKGYSIPKYAMKTNLRWIANSREHVMKLTISDSDTDLFNVYSTGSDQTEYEIEQIAFQIREELRKAGIANDGE